MKMKTTAVLLLLIGPLSLITSVRLMSAVPCKHHIQRIDSFPDGYRAKLNLPVLETTDGWRVEIEFDKNITVFDTPDGNLENGVKSGPKFTVVNYIHNSLLPGPSTLVIEFTVHYPRTVVPSPEIKKISFGKFLCTSEEEEAPKAGCVLANELPLCGNFVTKGNQWPDGFQAKLALPVKRSVDSWRLLLIFNKPIKVLDFPNGNLDNKLNSKEFKVKSKDYNGKLKQGDVTSFDFTVHYERGQIGTNLVAIIFDPVQFICTDNKHKDILKQRYSNHLNADSALIGQNWIGGCEKQIPECSTVFERTQFWPDGFKGILKIPVKTAVNGWNVTVYFDGKIRNFDVHQGDKIRAIKGVYFVVKNYKHNARLGAGTTFKFEITVHFSRSLKKRPQVSLVRFRNEDICENKEDCDN